MSKPIYIVSFAIIASVLVVLAYILTRRLKEHYSQSRDLSDLSALQYNIQHSTRDKILQRIADIGQAPAEPLKTDIEQLRSTLHTWYETSLAAGKTKSMDKWGVISIDAALDSISMGNWAIGNVICYMPKGTENDPTSWVEILRGGNRFFTRNPTDILATNDYITRLDSHAHGEMCVLDAFEEKLSRGCYDKTSSNYEFDSASPIDFRKRSDVIGYGMPDNIVLFTQLNSCQMCLSRIGNAGISRCYWLAPDTAGGLAHKLCDSVPAYFNMLNRQIHDVADVSPELIQFAFQAFAGPDAKWVTYCTWKLGQTGSPANLVADYQYCKGQYYANTKVGQNTMYDWSGFFRTVDKTGGPTLSCTVTPPKSN